MIEATRKIDGVRWAVDHLPHYIGDTLTLGRRITGAYLIERNGKIVSWAGAHMRALNRIHELAARERV